MQKLSIKSPQVTTSLRLPRPTLLYLKDVAARKSVTISFLIRSMIIEYARDPRNVDTHIPILSESKFVPLDYLLDASGKESGVKEND